LPRLAAFKVVCGNQADRSADLCRRLIARFGAVRVGRSTPAVRQAAHALFKRPYCRPDRNAGLLQCFACHRPCTAFCRDRERKKKKGCSDAAPVPGPLLPSRAFGSLGPDMHRLVSPQPHPCPLTVAAVLLRPRVRHRARSSHLRTLLPLSTTSQAGRHGATRFRSPFPSSSCFACLCPRIHSSFFRHLQLPSVLQCPQALFVCSVSHSSSHISSYPRSLSPSRLN
jgi:hypothetical protein